MNGMIVRAENLEGGFSEINCDKIKIIQKGKRPFIKEIYSILVKCGEFGTVIIDENGEISHNNDYAFCCKIFKRNLMVFKFTNGAVTDFMAILKIITVAIIRRFWA